MKLPNILTVSRFFLTFIFIAFIFKAGLASKIIAAIVFTIASFTDFFDGYYAKKYNLVSDFGKLMDPIADKFLTLAAFFVFTQMQIIPLWMFVIILLREVLITAMRLFAMNKGKVLAAEKAGKYKTVLQITAIYFMLIFIVLKEMDFFVRWTESTVAYWQYGIYSIMFMAVILTLFSGGQYLWNNRRALI